MKLAQISSKSPAVVLAAQGYGSPSRSRDLVDYRIVYSYSIQ
jgi:hypothetical protein